MINPYLRIHDSSKRTIIIGDIHGCLDEMLALLNSVQFNDSDLLISVGDMVDRGPFSWDVIKFFWDNSNTFSVIGNHERRLAGTIRRTSEPAWSQKHTLSKIDKNEYDSLASYLESLPAVIETDQVIVTHARLDPEKDLNDQDLYHTCAVGGAGVKIEVDSEGIPLWYHNWEKIHTDLKPICFGHIGYKRVELIPQKLYALDTGAVKEGFLTALVLPEHQLINIRCDRNYYEISKEEWMQTVIGNVDPNHMPIYKVLKIMSKAEKTITESNVINLFSEYLNNLDLQNRIIDIKSKFRGIFGEIPPGGSSRGEYVIRIKGALPQINSRLINHILFFEIFDQDKLIKMFEGKSLGLLNEEIIKLEKWIA